MRARFPESSAPAGCPDLTLVIACYNEASILERNVGETLKVLDALRVETALIFVDDASEDETSAVIERLAHAHASRRFTCIQHATNMGRGRSVTDGIRAATSRYVGFLDIDLEVHPRYVLPCLLALEQGFDVATGSRICKFTWRSANRYVMSRGYRLLARTLLGVPLLDPETGFKFFRREAIMPVLAETRDGGWFWDTEIMTRAHLAGLRIAEISVLFQRQFEKRSTVKPIRDSLVQIRKLSAFRREAARLRGVKP